MTQEERIDQLLEAVEQLITHTQALNKRIDDFFCNTASLYIKDERDVISFAEFDPWAADNFPASIIPLDNASE